MSDDPKTPEHEKLGIPEHIFNRLEELGPDPAMDMMHNAALPETWRPHVLKFCAAKKGGNKI